MGQTQDLKKKHLIQKDFSVMPANTADLKKLKVTELRDELSNRGLDTKGVKDELISRLAAAMETEDGAAEPAAAAPVEEDEEEPVVVVAASPLAKAATAAPIAASLPFAAAATTTAALPSGLPILTEEEKRKLREERFGRGAAAAATKKSSEAPAIAGLGHFDPAEEFDRRKKRAGRFGLPVPESKLEAVAKKKARAERFGIEIPLTAVEVEAKKKVREERFKTMGGAAPGSTAAEAAKEKEDAKTKLEERAKRFAAQKA